MIEWKSEGEADFFDCSWESSFILSDQRSTVRFRNEKYEF